MNINDILKQFTPAMVTMLSIFGILGILLIICGILLIIFRKSKFTQGIIWNIREFRDLLSSRPSYYSQKRIKSSVAFYSGIIVILSYDWLHRHDMKPTEMAAHALILFSIAGYHLSKTQEEKLTGTDVGDDSVQPEPDPTPVVLPAPPTPPAPPVVTTTTITTTIDPNNPSPPQNQ